MRRAGPLGLALTAYDLYCRLPPAQRRRVLDLTLTHGPRLAARAAKAYGSARRRPYQDGRRFQEEPEG